jgi:hypothetical protein
MLRLQILQAGVDPPDGRFGFGQYRSALDESPETHIDSDVVYWLSNEPFAPGECLPCEISIPRAEESTELETHILRGHLRILRVELKGLGPGFGITAALEGSEFAVLSLLRLRTVLHGGSRVSPRKLEFLVRSV